MLAAAGSTKGSLLRSHYKFHISHLLLLLLVFCLPNFIKPEWQGNLGNIVSKPPAPKQKWQDSVPTTISLACSLEVQSSTPFLSLSLCSPSLLNISVKTVGILCDFHLFSNFQMVTKSSHVFILPSTLSLLPISVIILLALMALHLYKREGF